MTMDSNRAQAHTLEGIAAAILVLASVIFALQVTAVTPLTASTASQHIENQQKGAATGLLVTADERGALREMVLYWNESGTTFHNISGNESFYTTRNPPTEFGELLEETFAEQGIAYNVNLRFLTTDGDQRERSLVYLGKPSDHSVTVHASVPIYDDDHILDADRTENSTTVSEATFYAPDVSPESHLYNVIEVEVILWRM